jgi:hypothetical protein
MWKIVFITLIFLAGLYTTLNYSTWQMTEPFTPRCPDLLVQQGSEIWLRNTKLAEIPGVNPVKFSNLEEYTRFYEWQKSQKIDCPVLFLQQSFDAQNEPTLKQQPPPDLLVDASRGNPPYNTNSYPGMDPTNQALGRETVLDVYGEIGTTQEKSPNPMDPNWGGAEYSMAAVKAGNYQGDEVYKPMLEHTLLAPPFVGQGERDLRTDRLQDRF